MSLADIYENHEICRIEEKLEVLPVEQPEGKPGKTFIGKYPLEPVKYKNRSGYEAVNDGTGGTYGGEIIAAAIHATWASIENPDFSPHSVHSYFAKPGSHESPIRWEIQEINTGKSFASRSTTGYQLHSNVIVCNVQVSFVKNNSIEWRRANNKLLLQMQKKPQEYFFKYKDILDDMNYFAHLHDFVENIVPPDFFQPTYGLNFNEGGSQEFGYFVRFNDNNEKCKNLLKSRYAQLAYITDNFYLGVITKALGLPVLGSKFDHLDYLRISLDHSIYFHDTDFDPLEWMFVDFRFSNYNNDRTLAQCTVFTLEGKMIASVAQEALCVFKPHFHEAFKENASIALNAVPIQPKI